jgi:hypothetical protein
VYGELELHSCDFAREITHESRPNKKRRLKTPNVDWIKTGKILRSTERCASFHTLQAPRVDKFGTIPAISLLLQFQNIEDIFLTKP